MHAIFLVYVWGICSLALIIKWLWFQHRPDAETRKQRKQRVLSGFFGFS